MLRGCKLTLNCTRGGVELTLPPLDPVPNCKNRFVPQSNTETSVTRIRKRLENQRRRVRRREKASPLYLRRRRRLASGRPWESAGGFFYSFFSSHRAQTNRPRRRGCTCTTVLQSHFWGYKEKTPQRKLVWQSLFYRPRRLHKSPILCTGKSLASESSESGEWGPRPFPATLCCPEETRKFRKPPLLP